MQIPHSKGKYICLNYYASTLILIRKPVPIPGTGLILNTPEAIEGWLAERKKRWPSKQNVENKQRKAREAAERGEIDPSALTMKSRKRPRLDEDSRGPSGSRERGRGRGRGRSRELSGRGQGSYRGLPDSGWRGRGQAGSPTPLDASHQPVNCGNAASSSDDSTSESDSDMDPIRDAVPSKLCDPDLLDQDTQETNQDDGPNAVRPTTYLPE